MTTSRRAVLAGVGGIAGAAALTVPVAAAPDSGQEVTLQSSYVAAMANHARARTVARLRDGERLVLKREPQNGYDRRAVAVWTEAGEKLGYLPRTDNKAVAALIDAGLTISARISDLRRRGARPEIRLDVSLALPG